MPHPPNRAWRIYTLVAGLAVLAVPSFAKTGKHVPPARLIPATKSASARDTVIDPDLQTAIKNAPSAKEWPNNNYARLLDTANVVVQPDGTVVADYREVYKLFNERARDLAEVNLPYNSSYQTLKVTRARTIRKNGSVQVVKPADIRESSPYSDFALYDDSMSVGFSMPGIEDDCVIDYSFRIVTRPVLLPGNFWDFWAFSGPEPVGVSRFTITVPTSKTMHYLVHNNDALKPVEVASADGHQRVYTWEMRNIKPVDMEPAMPDKRDVMCWMEVSSLPSWQDISRWYWSLAKSQTAPDDSLKTTVAQLTTGKKTDDEKARAIYDFAANRIRYVGLEFGLSAFKPHSAREVHEKLYGDCKDKATLLITMLNLAGIKAHPVLLAADDKRAIRDQLPSLNAFNHCIAVADIGGKHVWLDSTAETCEYGDIPSADRGADAFVIRDGEGQFERIPSYQAKDNGSDIRATVTLHDDGSADMLASADMRGSDGQDWRGLVRTLTPDQRQQMTQQLAQIVSVGTTVVKADLPDGVDKAGPFSVNMTLRSPNLVRQTSHLLLVPAIIGVREAEKTNPFVKETRVWPVVINEPAEHHSTTVINIPSGYSIEDLPPDVDLTGPLSEYHRKVAQSSDGKQITVSWTMTQRSGTVKPADYAEIRAYHDRIIKTNDDLIVLRKNG